MAQPYVGEIRIFAGNFAPAGWEFCSGQLLPISENETLFQLIGTTYGGDGQETFALPDLRSRVPIHQGQGGGLSNRILAETGGTEEITLTVQQLPVHSHTPLANSNAGNEPSPINNVWAAQSIVNQYTSVTPVVPLGVPSMSAAGGSQPHENIQPYLCLNFIISLFGIFPSQSGGNGGAEPFLSELRTFSFNFAPGGWAMCNGQLLPINQNQALFSLLGTTYGGNGQTNFALPDLRARVPIHVGSGHTLGERAGQENHTLTLSEMPQHTHLPNASSAEGNLLEPGDAFWGSNSRRPYSSLGANTAMNPAGCTNVGGSQPHSNMQPFLTLTVCIALQGIFPSQN